MNRLPRTMLYCAVHLLVVSLAFGHVVVATTYYVNRTTGLDGNAGTSSGSAFKTISHALSVAASGDTIKVAGGTYNKTLGEVFPLEMKTGVVLMSTAGAATTIIDANGAWDRVVNCSGNANTTIIQGFTITGGYVRDTSGSGVVSKGGGIYIDGGSPIIERNIITANIARGYDFYQAGLGANNGGTANGGGIYIANSGAPIIRNNVISYNIVQGGGGKDYRGGWSGNGSAGGNVTGGGIYAGSAGAAMIINNTFYGNSAIGGLGGSSNSLGAGDGGNATAGGIYSSFDAIVKNNIFSNNSAIGGTVGGGSGGSNGTATDGALSYFQGVNFSYNLYYNNTATTNPDGGNLGTNNILGNDPLFVSTSNFHFASTASPAYHSGTATGAPAKDFDGTTRGNPPSIGAFEGLNPASSVGDEDGFSPLDLTLGQNYPNPFNPTTTIDFTVSHDGVATLKIFDVLGRELATLADGEVKAGSVQRTVFDATRFPSGLYFARLESGTTRKIIKMQLLK